MSVLVSLSLSHTHTPARPTGLSHLNQRSDILVLDCSLARHLVKPSSVGAISHALILKVTLATLIANRTVQWVICQQKLHDAFSCLVGEGTIRLDHHSRLYRPSTRCHRLRSAFDFDQTHSAISRNHQFLVVAVSRHRGACFLACLDECRSGCEVLSACQHQTVSDVRPLQYIRGTETFLPSIVSSTSAWRLEVVAKVRAARLPLRAASAGARGMERNRWDRILIAGLTVVLFGAEKEKWRVAMERGGCA